MKEVSTSPKQTALHTTPKSSEKESEDIAVSYLSSEGLSRTASTISSAESNCAATSWTRRVIYARDGNYTPVHAISGENSGSMSNQAGRAKDQEDSDESPDFDDSKDSTHSNDSNHPSEDDYSDMDDDASEGSGDSVDLNMLRAPHETERDLEATHITTGKSVLLCPLLLGV